VNERWQPAQAMRGLLLVRAEAPAVTRWVRGGLVACQLIPLAPWTAVVPVEPSSRAHAPYDGAASVLLGRPVPRRLRPSLGFLVADQRAAVVVRAGGLRDRPRWLLWQPGRGPVRTRELTQAGPGELAGAAGRPAAGPRVAAVVRDRSGDAHRLLTDLLTVLELPGADLLGPHVGLRGQVVAPTAQAVARFDTRMAEIARHHRELEDS
jgi:hypothetical protein